MRRYPINSCRCDDLGCVPGPCPYCVGFQRDADAASCAIEASAHRWADDWGAASIPPPVYDVFWNDDDELDFHSGGPLAA